MDAIEAAELVRSLANQAPLAVDSLKASQGQFGGVDSSTSVFRVSFDSSQTAVLKTFQEVRHWREELANLVFLQEVAPEHSAAVLSSREGAILLEDLGSETVATRCRSAPTKGLGAWFLWAEAFAVVHARASSKLPRLDAVYAPEKPRTAVISTADQLLEILDHVADRTRAFRFKEAERLQLRECLLELERRLGQLQTHGLVFGFSDANPMNAVIRDERVHFVDVGGPALGLASRAFFELWRYPEPNAVRERYVSTARREGRSLELAELEEEGALYDIENSLIWLTRHLAAAAEGGRRDIDGRQLGYDVADRFNMDMIIRLTTPRTWLAPLRKAAETLRSIPVRLHP
ncbi:MAG: hypothetical protein GEU75_06695 [Dehalococcoidia bacterium]|nr:hypothetical protein [Dehalococcoidia bacterium]